MVERRATRFRNYLRMKVTETDQRSFVWNYGNYVEDLKEMFKMFKGMDNLDVKKFLSWQMYQLKITH